ncbi:hypothetical protein Ga0076813_159819 [endosymbiont of Ridgeia piscesae]|uniref:Uncharacterized protein n=1 Tax=endosymbiont of Ridgeia piscesae TaxID=54398 RepID=A0A0T5ZA78_9GAMM|nr:hypothetical protein Ga0076813_159819 [endosymbiont of Ridgeia piscesae]
MLFNNLEMTFKHLDWKPSDRPKRSVELNTVIFLISIK